MCTDHIFSQPPTNGHFGGFVLQCYKQCYDELSCTSIFVHWDMYFCKPKKRVFLGQRRCTFEIIMYTVYLLSKKRLLISTPMNSVQERVLLQILIIYQILISANLGGIKNCFHFHFFHCEFHHLFVKWLNIYIFLCELPHFITLNGLIHVLQICSQCTIYLLTFREKYKFVNFSWWLLGLKSHIWL